MNETILASQLYVYNQDRNNTYISKSTNLDWLAKTFSHRSAPAIKTKGEGWSTLQRTLTKEQFLSYWRSRFEIIALRFAKDTNHLVLDVDAGSPYHPTTDRESFNLILQTLEDAGLVSPIIYQSSNSGGLHILYPLPEERNSYAVARTVEMVLASAGFWLRDGALEAFPNRKSWVEKGKDFIKGIKHHELFDYRAVRIPCQAGYVLLDGLTLEPVGPVGDDSLSRFRHCWDWCCSNQDLESFDAAIAHFEDKENWPKKPRKFGRLAEIEKDYQALLQAGWSANHQTNEILGNLSRLVRIMEPCPDGELAALVMEKAVSMPGYRQHCRHQHEIERRCKDWARHIIRRGYYWHGERIKDKPAPEQKRNLNEERSQKAVKRIENYLKGLIKQGFTYGSKTAIIAAVVKAIRCSKTTLVKHWDKFAGLAKQLLTSTTPEQQQKQSTATHPDKTAGDGTHPNSTKRIGSVNSPSVSDVPCPFDDDWEPPPPPKPRFCFEFNDFAQTLPPPTETPDYAKIPDYISRAFAALVRTAYSPDFESLQAIAGELNRCRPGVILPVVEWIESLPVVPERQQPKPPKPDKDEIQELKKIRRRANFKRFKARVGGGAYV